MKISIIAAVDKNLLIGKKDKLPWKIPEDLQYFKLKTKGKSVIMGKSTFLGLPGKLKERDLIVLSEEKLEGVKTANSIEKALDLADHSQEIIIAGGKSVYEQFLPLVDKMYLTYIDHEFEGDVYFPNFDQSKWSIIEEKIKQTDKYKLKFVTYKKI